MSAINNYDQINDDIEILEQKLNKISQYLVKFDRTKMVPERERLLQSVSKDLVWSKKQVEQLKHDMFSCPKEYEAELTEKL